MADTYVAHTAADYAQAIESELPQGAAWSREPDGPLMQWVTGCAQIWGDVSAAADTLMFVEADPRFTFEMLPDWEANYGLPDPCLTTVLSLNERRNALLQKITIQGAASRAFFIDFAASLGYAITITEYVPFQFGLSQFGGSHGAFQGPTARFYWTVKVESPRIARFSFGGSSFGRDPFLEITRAEDLECVINRWKPTHTIVLFSYVTHDSSFEFFFPY
ncbi:YmfQ family protein [Beijerinckia sp. L45]|uniref:YmfQ family protein n=1 Tax=Beijerinckia sp. L45 TaxID=1641855 RepID=UPI00131DF38E|nr:putative phage tail protein [Beijerinckia sp. L45]